MRFIKKYKDMSVDELKDFTLKEWEKNNAAKQEEQDNNGDAADGLNEY